MAMDVFRTVEEKPNLQQVVHSEVSWTKRLGLSVCYILFDCEIKRKYFGRVLFFFGAKIRV